MRWLAWRMMWYEHDYWKNLFFLQWQTCLQKTLSRPTLKTHFCWKKNPSMSIIWGNFSRYSIPGQSLRNVIEFTKSKSPFNRYIYLNKSKVCLLKNYIFVFNFESMSRLLRFHIKVTLYRNYFHSCIPHQLTNLLSRPFHQKAILRLRACTQTCQLYKTTRGSSGKSLF